MRGTFLEGKFDLFKEKYHLMNKYNAKSSWKEFLYIYDEACYYYMYTPSSKKSYRISTASYDNTLFLSMQGLSLIEINQLNEV